MWPYCGVCQLACCTFELSLGAWLDLLRLSHSFDELLNHHTVLVSSVAVRTQHNEIVSHENILCNSRHEFALPWVDFQVVVTGYSVNFNFLLWWGLQSERKEKCNNTTLKLEGAKHELGLAWLPVCGMFCLQFTHHDGLVLDAEFLHSCPVQLPQQTHDAGFFPRTWWTVDQQVRKVAALDLQQTMTRGENFAKWRMPILINSMLIRG